MNYLLTGRAKNYMYKDYLTDGRADSGRQYQTASAKSARLRSYSHEGKVILMLYFSSEYSFISATEV